MRRSAAGPILIAAVLVMFAGCQQAETPPTGAADSAAATDAAPATDQSAEPSDRPKDPTPQQPAGTAQKTLADDATDEGHTAQTEDSDEPAVDQVAAAKNTTPSSKPAPVDDADVPQPDAEMPQPQQSEKSPSLSIGDPAPPLSIAQWVTGDQFDGFDAGQLYVVEFWATWCGPCRTSMPHVSALSQQLGDDVTIVGITDEDMQTVESFLDEEQSEGTTWRDVVTYRLAIDEDGATNDAYMRAADQSDIPTAFIVGRDGVIEWIGHPMAMDQPLASLIDGTFDRPAAIAEFEKQRRLRNLTQQLRQVIGAGDFDAALELMDAVAEEFGESSGLMMTKLALLQRVGRHEEAAALQQQLVKRLWDNAMVLNQIAWEIAIGDAPRDLDLALRAAKQASELTEHANVSILDTLARVYYEQGDLEQAIVWQEKAAEHGGNIPQVREALEKYKAEQAAADAEESASPDADSAEPADDPDEPSEDASSAASDN